MSSEASPNPVISFDNAVVLVTRWLGLLVAPDGVVELRALKCKTDKYRKPHTRSGFFDVAHLREMAHEAVTLSHHGASGVYLTLNPVHHDLLSRRCNRIDFAESGTLATDANITRRRWLLVDADPKRIADVSSTDAEKALARETIESVRSYLRGQNWPEPLLADSGNGYHLLYRVDQPVDEHDLVERCLRALARRFDNAAVKIDTQVFNPSRVVKLYGTFSRKGDHTTERPHRLSLILEGPSNGPPAPVPVERLEALAATAPSPSAISEPSAPSGARKPKNVLARAQRYLAKLPKAISGQGGHSATFHAACSLVLGFDLTPDEAYPLLAAWNQTHCEEPWDEHDLRHKLQDADKKDGKRGYLLDRRRTNPHSQGNGPHQPMANGVSASAVSADGGGADSRPVFGADANYDKPTIDAGNRNLQEVTAQAWAAIDDANHPPSMFRYGGLPSRLERDDQNEPIVRQVDEDRMRHVLARVAHWTKEVGSGDDVQIVDAMPPKDVVKDVLATPDMPLPVLTRIVEAPVFASDGTLQTDPGYHPASRTLYIPQPGFQVPNVSEQPSAEEIEQARSLFCDDLLVDFPFGNESDRAHALALHLLPFARGLIAGATPLHLVEKPSPGTGATLLVDVLSFATLGRSIAAMTEARNEDEWRKRLTAKLRTGTPFLFIDNLKRPLDSAALAAAITSDVWEDRLLGQSETLRLPVKGAWVATGNNPIVSNEMARRIIRIRLDAKSESPWLRTQFKHDVRVWSRQNRDELVWAALTLIRAWIAAGRPDGVRKLGMFECWSSVMGGILEVAGIRGFLENQIEVYNESVSEEADWRAFISSWWACFGSREVKVAELFRLVGDDVCLPLGDGAEHSRKVRLGKMLTSSRDRVFEINFVEAQVERSMQVTLRRGDAKQNAIGWRLEPSEQSVCRASTSQLA